jgi:alkylation response protein AidB-like acyl-CoA dehydrogenase
MPIELQAKTEPGARLISLAETLAEDFATRAGVHDKEGSYPFESIEALREAGYFVAPIAEEHGGLGVTSVHDVVVASSRLARGDASVAIGVNMHLTVLRAIVRRWQIARAAGNERRTAAFGTFLDAVTRDGIVLAAAVSERSQDLTRPSTTAVRTESGWRVDGSKVFCTMSPAATVLYTAVTFTDDSGRERYGYAQVPADTPGVIVHDDWDALGMRASGSNSVTFDGAELPESALRGGFAAGDPVPYMDSNLTAGLFHASASLGIAEGAYRAATDGLTRRGVGLDAPRTQMLAAESAIDLFACQAAIARAASVVDDHFAANPATDGTGEEITAVFAEVQTAKTFVNEMATRVVDRALALSGGAGYLNGSPLARAYRDVRAGAFMHPLGANRAYDFVGQVALGLDPALR